MPARRFLLCLAAMLSSLAAARAEVADGPAVAEIRAMIAREGSARIIVEMALPEAETAQARERAAAEPATPASVAAKIERNRALVADAAREMRAALAAADITMQQEYEHLPMFVTDVDAARLERLMRMPGVRAIHLDKPLARRQLPGNVLYPVPTKAAAAAPAATPGEADVAAEAAARASAVEAAADDPNTALLSSTVTYINADDAWARGFTGQGQSIAILDDGIDRNHDMFIGKIVAEACYSTKGNSTDVALCPGGAASSTAPGAASNCAAATNACAHGSHVAGIAAGNDTTGSVTLRGVAHGANLIPIQVFTLVNDQTDCDNEAPCLLAYSSAILSGLNYAIGQAGTHKLAAVNLSLGGKPQSGACDGDVRKPAIDTLRGLGVLTTIAAGNDGKVGEITPPACISTALAVSATIITVPDSGVNHAANVDVLAPGVLVRSAGLNNSYVSRSGTSMAAPHVAGAVAILKSAKPTASAVELETALKTGGIPTTLSSWSWSTPRLDVNKSLDLLGAPSVVTGVALPGVFGSKNLGGTSYLRFFNADTAAATMTIQIYDDVTGQKVGTWTRQIRGLASPQISMAEIEAESSPPVTSLPGTVQYYTLFVDAPFTGFAQHVLYSPQTSLLSNLSFCGNGVADSGRYALNTHTTLINGYTSFLLVHNTGTAEARPSFDVRDARDGAQIGTFTTSGAIKPQTSALIDIQNLLQVLGKQPDSSQFHLNLIMSQTGFTGFAQHWVQNAAQGIVTNISAKCDI